MSRECLLFTANLLKKAIITGRAWLTVEVNTPQQPQCAMYFCAV